MKQFSLMLLAAVVGAVSACGGETEGLALDADIDDLSDSDAPVDAGGESDGDGDESDDAGDLSCLDISCSGHGACQLGPRGPACLCDEGHDGDDCGSCAEGYQDNDDDGSCFPDCARAAPDCDLHAACDDSEGSARCACLEGRQDHDEDGTCMATCAAAGLECEPLRHCDDWGGEAACVCDRGRTGEDCRECADGFLPVDDGCEPDHEWTVIVYMAADNELEPFARTDIEELTHVGSSDSLHLVVLIDSFFEESRILYIEPGEQVVVSEPGELDTGDYRTLGDFGAWAVTAYPARRTALLLWDHGAGWKSRTRTAGTRGFAFDAHGSAAGISISRGELGRSLERITGALGGERIDVVGFDACRMGMWEVALATAPYADVLVASSEDEPLDGWPYVAPLRALRANPSMVPLDLAATLVEAYTSASALHFTLAATDLGALEAVSSAVDALAGALLAHRSTFADVESVRVAAQGFGDPDARDLWDVARKLSALEGAPVDVVDAAEHVISELSIALIESRSQPSHPNAQGLSIYLPGRSAGMDAAYAAPAAPWSSNRWVDFVAAFTAE